MRSQRMKGAVLILAVVAFLTIPALNASAGQSEFGIGLPISSTFSFTSINYELEAYYRWSGSLLAWDTAFMSDLSFSSVSIRNTLATAGSFHLCVGHVTNLWPSLGTTYFTAGLGAALGQTIVIRTVLNLAIVYSGGNFYFFPEIRFQFGIDP